MNEETTEKLSTRSVGIRFGLFNALAGILLFAVAVVLNDNPFKGVWNWIGIGVSLALVFLAHKQFKDNGTGYMEYSQGVGIGFWIGIASLITVPVMYVYLTYVDSAPFELFLQSQEDEMIKSGAPENIIETSMKWTKKLFWPMAIVMGVIASVVMALIMAIFTKKSNPEMPA